ncbi:hypothetical protein J6590_005523 [Homalodisca vitripennis]|nr:hypothetical protein J6590_005523 [Homalodisca vitripennis]
MSVTVRLYFDHNPEHELFYQTDLRIRLVFVILEVPPSVKIHVEGYWALLSVISPWKNGKPALYQPLQLKQEGDGSHNYSRHLLQKTGLIDLPLQPDISTFALSDVTLQDIH